MIEKRKVIAIGSTEHLKIEALDDFLQTYFGKRHDYEITGVKVGSGVNKQPCGKQEIYRGALNRAQKTLKKVLGADLAIGIENGIEDLDGNWIDYAIIVGLNAKGQIFISTSPGVQLPTDLVVATREIGFDRTTVGQMIEYKSGRLDLGITRDPHKYLTERKVTRKETLIMALKILFAQVKF